VDVYAVGIILYELLVGQTPFQADTFMGILTKHMFEAPAAPTQVNPNADVPPDVEAIILKALQKDKEYRFQSMNEFREAIEAVGTGAGAVSVVHENVAMPSGGRTEFTGGRTYPPATQPPLEGDARKSKMPLVAGLVGLLAVGGIGAAMTLKSEPPAPPVEAVPPAPVAAAAPTPAAPVPAEAPAPVQKVLAADAKKVTFKITTPGIDAQILDARDEAIFGMTNSAAGVLVEESEEPLNLILRAPGYEDLEFPIVPDRDKTFEKELVKKRVAKPRPGGGSKPGADTKTPPPEPKDTKPEKPTEKPTEPKDKPKPKVPVQIQGNQDLKDPFGRGG
jgi:serine/threonine-protein kinase